MTLYVFLLWFFFILCLVLLWNGDWPHHCSLRSRPRAVHALVQRLLKPRTPVDCPICRLCSSGVRPASAPVRPWGEVKSRWGAPKRIPTEGFACPDQQCPYFGITDAHIHALVGDGKHGHAERIQTFRCQACHTTFSARRHTPMYRLKTPSHQIAVVLSTLAEGLDPSAAERVFGFRQATITTWLSRAGEHAQTLHEHFFCHLQLPHLQLDELRTRLRCAKEVLWLWLAIDPCTKILPVLSLGPSFWAVDRGQERTESTSVAGGSGPDLRSGEKMLPTAQAGSGHTCDAPGDRRRSHSRLTGTGPFWTAEHRFHRAGESDSASRSSSSGTSNLGHVPTDLTASGSPRVVARLLSLCAPS